MSRIIHQAGQAQIVARRPGVTVLGVIIALALVTALASLYFLNAAATAPSAAESRIQNWVNQLSAEQLTPSRHLAQQNLEQAGEASVDPLIAALHSPNAALRRNSAEMLGFIAPPRGLEPLGAALANDPASSVRSRAAWALGELYDVRAASILERASVLDENRQVRQEASASLDALRSHLALSAAKNDRLVSSFAVAPSQPNVVYLAEMNQISFSHDGGRTWNETVGTLPSRVTALAVSPSDPNLIYAGTESLGLYKSTDGGMTWAPRNAGLGLEPGMRLSVTAIAIDPQSPDRVYAAGGVWIGTSQARLVSVGVALSPDGGDSWQILNLPAARAQITRLVIVGHDLYLLAKGGVSSIPL